MIFFFVMKVINPHWHHCLLVLLTPGNVRRFHVTVFVQLLIRKYIGNVYMSLSPIHSSMYEWNKQYFFWRVLSKHKDWHGQHSPVTYAQINHILGSFYIFIYLYLINLTTICLEVCAIILIKHEYLVTLYSEVPLVDALQWTITNKTI